MFLQLKAWAAGAAQKQSLPKSEAVGLTPAPLGRVEGVWPPKSRQLPRENCFRAHLILLEAGVVPDRKPLEKCTSFQAQWHLGDRGRRSLRAVCLIYTECWASQDFMSRPCGIQRANKSRFQVTGLPTAHTQAHHVTQACLKLLILL